MISYIDSANNNCGDSMKLYIRRDKNAENSLFIVYDELCKEKYYVTGTKDKLVLYNMDEIRVMTIRRVPLPAVKAFSITAGKRNIKFLITPANSKVPCYYYGVKWHIRGNIFVNSFDILDVDNSVVATNAKRFSPCGDGYELNVYSENKELFCIATALCINIVAKVDNQQLQTV